MALAPVGFVVVLDGIGLGSLAVGFWQGERLPVGWFMRLEQLGTFAWTAVHNEGAKGAPAEPSAFAFTLSLGSNERKVKSEAN